MMYRWWWKILSIVLLVYVCTAGFMVKVPVLDGRLQQSIRNLFFHVPMWISMMVLFSASVFFAIKYLQNPNPVYDIYSVGFANVGIVFGLLGLVTGMIWANYQWGAFWSGDPKQNGVAIALLIYFAYFVLRGSVTDIDKRSKISAVYNVFAYCMLFPTLWILPRLSESLHPGGEGSEGNPALNPNDTTSAMKLVMIPAFIGWTLLGVWIATIRIRIALLAEKKLENK
ncbi:MAG: cytochrome c biogenesis protein [Chitinophagaceae bacterium]|jgi:heme exporter protein C|nr:cytochrome c biogenesis protein [Chitinophagaceae bacterium]